MMCDPIVADASARFGQPELLVAIMPGSGGTRRLLRSVGKQTANLMLVRGEPIGGARAYQLGLVAELVDESSTALERSLALAHPAARVPLKVLKAVKRVMRQGADLPLDAALVLENREFPLLFGTPDKMEGMRAFLEKRSPEFTGR
jgi:enoyl-CoA hydratase